MKQHRDSDTTTECGPPKRGPGRPHNVNNNNTHINNNMTSSPQTATIKGKFVVGKEVLARWNDGLFYLGRILRVDNKNEKCYIKFEDDSEYWALFKDITKGLATSQSAAEISCVLCQGENSEKPNEIVLCDNCGLGYHQHCHNPVISEDILQPHVQWVCRKCVFATTAKKGGATKKGPNAQAMQVMKQSLPYQLSKLKWDTHHKTNEEQCYCYCGGPGDWYLKMLQCYRCRQWFHEACIQCLDKPLVYGDRFYIFACAICNNGAEYVKRLQVSWGDIAQIALFTFTMEHNTKYYEFNEDLMPWVNYNWDKLQTLQLASATKLDRGEKIKQALEAESSKFQSGKEIKKKHSLWGLRTRLPPSAPSVDIPAEGPINEKTMKQAAENTIKVKTFTPRNRHDPIPMRYNHKRRASTDADELLLRKPKRRKISHPNDGETVNGTHKNSQHYRGYSGNAADYVMNGHAKKRKSTGKVKLAHGEKHKPLNGQTLDSIIPWPSNYEGFNHPFKTVLERNTELANNKLKERLLSCYSNGFMNGDGESDSLASSITDSDTQSLSQYDVLTESTNHSRKRKRRSKAQLAMLAAAEEAEARKEQELEMLRKKPKVPNHAKNVVDKSMLDEMKHREIPLCQLKSSMENYFGAADRLASGEGFQVLARRINPQGKIQYLVEWQGLVA